MKKRTKKHSKHFSRPRSEIAKEVLTILLISGMVAIAATSPYFVYNLLRVFKFKQLNKYKNKKVYDTFYNLKKQGLIVFTKRGRQIYISLTEKGKKKAGWLKIDNLKIKKPRRWDRKWRILLFDIAEMKRIYREALRGKLKDLGFVLFQKSAWISPYDCAKEVNTLKSFFGLNSREIKLIVSGDIGDDGEFRKYFKL